MKVEIITPEKIIYRGEAEEIEVPAKEGYMGILDGHTPLFSMLSMGELWLRKGNEYERFFISGGYMDVLPNEVTLLPEEAYKIDDIDFSKVEEGLKEAQETIEKALKGEVSPEEMNKALYLKRKYELMFSLKKYLG